MITNGTITVFHKFFDKKAKIEKWKPKKYEAWTYGGKGSSTNKGYETSNDIRVRIPYSKNNLDLKDFEIGDILVRANVNKNIKTQQDLSGYEFYNITSIINNVTGNEKHLHIEGK